LEPKIGAKETAKEENHLPTTHLVHPDDEEYQNGHANLALEVRKTGLCEIQYQG
jgi:hypothetical protein